MSKDAVWFRHDSNARHDPKIRALRHRHGVAGYGAWWIIVEMLRDAEDYRLPHKPYVIESIALECGLDSTTVERLLNDCSTALELLETDGEYFWSASLNRRMQALDAKREQASDAGKKSAEQRKKANPPTDAQRPFNDRSTDAEQRREEERREEVKEKKEVKQKAECVAPPPPPGFTVPPDVDRSLLSVPTKDGKVLPLTDEELERYQKLYPSVDIIADTLAMHAYLSAKQSRRIPVNEVKSYLAGWYKRTADRIAREAAMIQANGMKVPPRTEDLYPRGSDIVAQREAAAA